MFYHVLFGIYGMNPRKTMKIPNLKDEIEKDENAVQKARANKNRQDKLND